jgi:hypothetical protein
MPIYDGVVSLAEADIPVIVELDNGHVRLSASGREIGQWPLRECEIVHLEDSTYTISAENETLRFVPSQPSLFGAAVDDGHRHLEAGDEISTPPSTATAEETERLTENTEEPADVDESEDGFSEAAPPRPLTVGLFYALCVVTAGVGIWALINIIV